MRVLLALGGGNALGAFHAGAYEALHEAGIEPDVIAGSSVGAVTGALIAGNWSGGRLPALREFWRRAAVPASLCTERASSLAAVMEARLLGRPALFRPVVARMVPESPFGVPAVHSLEPLANTLRQLLDIERVNRGTPRLVVQATDLAEGAGVVIDRDIRIEHLLASSAFPVDFEPVTVNGRVLCDGGMSANLPLGAVLLPTPREDTLCFAVDLFPARGVVPEALDGMLARRFDLLLSAQSRKEIELVVRAHAADPEAGNLVLAHVVHDGAGERVGQKMFDYSATAIERRWRAGRRAVEAVLGRLPRRPPRGLTVL